MPSRLRLRSALTFALTTGLLFTASCEEDGESDNHGLISVQFLRGTAETSSPFLGTRTFQLVFDYDVDCYSNFYSNNPQWRQDGVEGAPEFEDWTVRMCTEDVGGRIPGCSVTSIRQTEQQVVWQLVVEYEVTDPADGDIENRRALVAPLPYEDVAMCTGNITLRRANGLDINGNQIWVSQSFPGSPVASPTDGSFGQPISVRVARTGN
jgi:hypothetical protein